MIIIADKVRKVVRFKLQQVPPRGPGQGSAMGKIWGRSRRYLACWIVKFCNICLLLCVWDFAGG